MKVDLPIGIVSLLSLMGAFVLQTLLHQDALETDKSLNWVEQGRAVYIAEGCIHCHSQYVRPVGPDAELWGPVTDPDTALAQRPVLIGNRRQGPDLATVGLRRSRDWNRRHLINPDSVTPGSRMPSYAHLFDGDGRRGEALLAYLEQLQGGLKDIASEKRDNQSGQEP